MSEPMKRMIEGDEGRGGMRHWSRNDKFAFFGVLLAAVGVICSVFPQEIRRMAGFDRGASAPQSAPERNAAHLLKITVTGDGNTITIRAAKTPDEETVSPAALLGDRQENTYYLGDKKHAIVNVIGDHNTLFLMPDVKSRVQYSTIGDGTRVRDDKDK